MHLLLVLAHPNRPSLNHFLADQIRTTLQKQGHVVELLDLYPLGFDPVLKREELLRKGSFDPSVVQFAEKLSKIDGLIFIHPDWWGLPPALLKGWVDRVLLPGVGYAYEENGRVVPLLTHVRASVVVTRDKEGEGLSRQFWLEQVFPLCGISPVKFYLLAGLKSPQGYEKKETIEKKVANLLQDLYTFFR
ncbi:MAG: NAD(P)H-dependent oxidoreductase [Spirochaetales bacterium]